MSKNKIIERYTALELHDNIDDLEPIEFRVDDVWFDVVEITKSRRDGLDTVLINEVYEFFEFDYVTTRGDMNYEGE